MRLAEIDPVQIVIIVIAMLGGFFQWLWGLMQQAREERERRRATPLDPEEQRLREEAWRRQVEAPQAPSPSQDKPVAPWDMVRELMEKAREAAAQPEPPPVSPARRPAPPPAQPARRPTPPPRTTPPAVATAVGPTPTPVATASLAPAPPTRSTSRPAPTHPLARRLTRPESVRQAILMREILGPPKALQNGLDSPN